MVINLITSTARPTDKQIEQFKKLGDFRIVDAQKWSAKQVIANVPNTQILIADIQITSQTRSNGKTSGTFVVKYIYKGEEQSVLTDIFRRMYGWE